MGGLETILPALSTGGIGASLVAVIVYLLRANTADRRDYRQAIDAWEDRWDESVAKYREIQIMLDEQRDLRRKAEDIAARATIAAERMSAEMAALRDEIKALRAQLAEMGQL